MIATGAAMALFFLWTAIAMEASKGLYSSVNCDCDEVFEGAILFCGLRFVTRAAMVLHSDLHCYYTTD